MKKYILLLLFPLSATAEILSVPVINVEPIYTDSRVYDTPTRTCELREIDPREDSFNLFGGVIGALAGHVITRKMTGSSVNRALGTAAGAMIGSKISNANKDKQMINDCTITNNYHIEKVLSGYNVAYMIDGLKKEEFFHYNPGSTISIEVNKMYTIHK